MDASFDFSQEAFPELQYHGGVNFAAQSEIPYNPLSSLNGLNDGGGWQDPATYAYYPLDGIDGMELGPEQRGGTVDEEEEEETEDKAMADYASQRFKRTKNSSASKKTRKRTAASVTTEEEQENEEIDETEQAEAAEFLSQLIPTALDGTDLGGIENDEQGQRLSGKKRPRWHSQESAFFRQCAALFDCNYTMIHDFLPHRTVADIKKQYDKQRVLYASLYASFGTTPRFQTVEEYRSLKAELEEAKEKLDESMRNLGVKPWAEGKKNRKNRNEEDDDEICAEEDEVDGIGEDDDLGEVEEI